MVHGWLALRYTKENISGGQIRIFSAIGPGDSVRAHREARAGNSSLTTSIAFSEQLISYCKHKQLGLLAISSNPRVDRFTDGAITIENRPKGKIGKRRSRGISFHLRELRYAVYLAYRAWKSRSDIALVDSGTCQYFALVAFWFFGIPIVVNLHNVLWPQGHPPIRRTDRIIRTCNAIFFRSFAAGAIGVSPECERQISSEARGLVPFYQYRCQFVGADFPKPSEYRVGEEFRIAFVGRLEANKGALDLVRIARILAVKCTVPVVFHVCGDGPALAELREAARSEELDDKFVLHGHLGRPDLLSIYRICHAVIVPTTSRFSEGMPQVCAEATIVGIPIIASRVTNALDVIGETIMEADTDDPNSYADKICDLTTDLALYDSLREQCHNASRQFFDRSKSFPAAFDQVLCKLFPNYRDTNCWDIVFQDLDRRTTKGTS